MLFFSWDVFGVVPSVEVSSMRVKPSIAQRQHGNSVPFECSLASPPPAERDGTCLSCRAEQPDVSIACAAVERPETQSERS